MSDIFNTLKTFVDYEDPDTVVWNYKRKWPDEIKKAIGDANRGKVHSEKQNREHSEKMKEQFKNGRITWNKGLKGAGKGKGVKPCVYRGKNFSSMTEAAEYFGVTVSAVSRVQKKNEINI